LCQAIYPFNQWQSQAFKVNGTIYVAAQIAAAPRVGFVIGPPTVTAERIFLNIETILKAAGSSLDRIVKTTVRRKIEVVSISMLKLIFDGT
jgi:enamine deaminase RidA (YjgF/YER057c/UK114 family)